MSTGSAAQLELAEEFVAVGSRPAASSLKMQTAERLAAHRALRQRNAATAAGQQRFEQIAVSPEPTDTRAMRIAAAVAERYAHTQSYRAFLAAEAERATQQARAAAEIATRNAAAIAAAQQQLLSDLESWAPEEEAAVELSVPHLVEAPLVQAAPKPMTVRLYEDSLRRERTAVAGIANAVLDEPLEDDERQALDEEIAFRQAPIFEVFLEDATPITANLIEFPRQLVAARKVRPRLAEGPLREEAEMRETNTQLRIFEVEAAQISTAVETAAVLPEWSSIRLGASPVAEPEVAPTYAASYPAVLVAAPFGLRLMATMVDASIILAGFLGFVTVTAYTAGQVPTGQLAALGAGVVLAALFLLYQMLFFTFGEATPGMRYARIGLCTLDDENPSRAAMRRRIAAVLLAACPLGLGFVWAWLDEDGLGWHDRISRMYPRSY